MLDRLALICYIGRHRETEAKSSDGDHCRHCALLLALFEDVPSEAGFEIPLEVYAFVLEALLMLDQWGYFLEVHAHCNPLILLSWSIASLTQASSSPTACFTLPCLRLPSPTDLSSYVTYSP